MRLPALIVLVVVLCGCTNTSQTPTNVQPQSWHSTTGFTGSTKKVTDTFNIQGEKWKITWSCDSDSKYGEMSIWVYKEGKRSSITTVSGDCPQTEDTGFIYDGPGDYYFDIKLANVDSWTIDVEDWY